jgi:hypothetical protein
MISIHEMLSDKGTVESYAYALLAGAVTSLGALVLASRLNSTDRSMLRGAE